MESDFFYYYYLLLFKTGNIRTLKNCTRRVSCAPFYYNYSRKMCPICGFSFGKMSRWATANYRHSPEIKSLVFGKGFTSIRHRVELLKMVMGEWFGRDWILPDELIEHFVCGALIWHLWWAHAKPYVHHLTLAHPQWPAGLEHGV